MFSCGQSERIPGSFKLTFYDCMVVRISLSRLTGHLNAFLSID